MEDGHNIKIRAEKIVLSDEQKLSILTEWNKRLHNPPSISELVKICWVDASNEDLDGRSPKSKAIKEFLSTRGYKIKSGYEKKTFELTPEQKTYIDNNAFNMGRAEIGKVLFPKASHNSIELKKLSEYYTSLPPENKLENKTEETLAFGNYTPPKTLEEVCKRINFYVKTAKFDPKNLNSKQLKYSNSLIGYLHNYRFNHQINLYSDTGDRYLFESTFISYCFDKDGLSEEDVDQFIMLATEKVMSSSIQKTIVMLEDEQRNTIESEGKLSVSLVDAVKHSRDEFNASIKRQGALYKTLTEERSKRLKENTTGLTIFNLVLEMKTEQGRANMIKEAERRNIILKDEVKRFHEMDDLIARIYGLDEELVING